MDTKLELVRRARAAGVGTDHSGTAAEPTRTHQTEMRYRHRGRQLVARWHSELSAMGKDPAQATAVEFASWLAQDIRPGLRPAAWRQYRQAALSVLDGADPTSTQAEHLLVTALKPERIVALPDRSSSNKAKRFPRADFDTVLAYALSFSRSAFAPTLADWLVAGLATGLRPSEWRAAELNGNLLYVVNGKSTNGRGNGDTRTLDVTRLSPKARHAVERMIERGDDWQVDGVYASKQAQVANLLAAVCGRATPGRTYSLYSLRHQFVANAKARLKAQEVSALAGHCTTRTIVRSYGKRRTAWASKDTRNIAVPVAAEVATVRSNGSMHPSQQGSGSEQTALDPRPGTGRKRALNV